jgi:DNA polymerase-1
MEMHKNTAGKLLVIDGGYATHRAFHALSSSKLSRSDGAPIWALHGFFISLAKLVAMRKPTHLLVAMDAPGGCPTRRNMLPQYKSNRTAPKPEFIAQATELALLLEESGLPVHTAPGWEADDIIASAAVLAAASTLSCEIFSADRDLYQTLSDRVRIVRIDGTTLGPSDVFERYGCSPKRYIELAAMRGDVADCITGVPKVGEKTAAKVVASYPSFESALVADSGLESIVPTKVAALIREHADVVRRNIQVATLRTDLPINLDRCVLPLDEIRLAKVLRKAELPAAASALVAACS